MTRAHTEQVARELAAKVCDCAPLIPDSHHIECPAAKYLCDCLDSFNWYKDPGPDGQHHPKCQLRVAAEAEQKKRDAEANARNKRTLDNFFSKL